MTKTITRINQCNIPSINNKSSVLMKYPSSSTLLLSLLLVGCSSTSDFRTSQKINVPTVVEAACGECKFGLKGSDCDLAIRVNGHSYFVDGVNSDSLGDAHSTNGICEVIRKARVTGEFKNGRFVATSFVLLPEH